jgi:hypothetical protein
VDEIDELRAVGHLQNSAFGPGAEQERDEFGARIRRAVGVGEFKRVYGETFDLGEEHEEITKRLLGCGVERHGAVARGVVVLPDGSGVHESRTGDANDSFGECGTEPEVGLDHRRNVRGLVDAPERCREVKAMRRCQLSDQTDEMVDVGRDHVRVHGLGKVGRGGAHQCIDHPAVGDEATHERSPHEAGRAGDECTPIGHGVGA